MKAIEITEPGKMRLTQRPQPQPQTGEVLLQVNRIGYCGSDLAAFRGINPLVTYPRVPGHEIGATIVALGEGVSGWSLGQEVLTIPYSNCGKCAACRKNRPNCCENNQTLGIQRDGALCEFVTAPVEKLLASDQLSARELALVEPLTVGFHATARGKVLDQDTVAVIGCGTVGLGAIAGSVFRGGRVIAIDIDDDKLEIAKACGAEEGINSKEQSVHERLRELTDDLGPDVVIEAVGHPQTYRMAVEEVCSAGRVVYVSWPEAPIEYDARVFVFKELDIRGSRNARRRDFHDVIQSLESGNIPVDRVVTRTVPLAEAPEAMQAWDAEPTRFTKIQIDLSA